MSLSLVKTTPLPSHMRVLYDSQVQFISILPVYPDHRGAVDGTYSVSGGTWLQ